MFYITVERADTLLATYQKLVFFEEKGLYFLMGSVQEGFVGYQFRVTFQNKVKEVMFSD